MKKYLKLTALPFLFFLLPVLLMAQNVGIGTSLPVERLEVNGGIKIGSTTSSNSGTIRFDGGKFEGNNNSNQWTPLGVPSGALIMAQDTGSLLQKGFFLLGRQEMNIQYKIGNFPGNWNPFKSVVGGAYFGSTIGVWTGSLVLVYYNNYVYRLDLTTNIFTKSSLNTVAGFQPRTGYNAVWTGRFMIISGGASTTGATAYNDGVKYDPSTDTWSSIAAAPVKRLFSSSVWTGTDMLIFGGDSVSSASTPFCTGRGFSSNQIYKYNLASNSWTKPTVTGTIPSARAKGVASWTGAEMLVYGGERTTDGTCNGSYLGLSDLYSFNPVTNTWTQKASDQTFNSSVGAWDGSKLYVWGTSMVDYKGYYIGRVYTLSSNSWSYFPNEGAARGSSNTFAVWNGAGLVICDGVTYQLFNPSSSSGIAYSLPAEIKYYLLQKN
ncbi:MAG: hypothetical protein FGM46_09085 [Ferruginibacter sp.]|nr:hypothetical protein [Ferruginibacter sp.]